MGNKRGDKSGKNEGERARLEGFVRVLQFLDKTYIGVKRDGVFEGVIGHHMKGCIIFFCV